MGTRALTIIRQLCENSKVLEEICVLYRQHDGYPSTHGQELGQFLKDMVIVNGIKPHDPRKTANGMDCLAAQIVANFKKRVGDFYLMSAGTRGVGEEYVYFIDPAPKEGLKPCIMVFDLQNRIFSGTAEELLQWLVESPLE